MKVNFNYLKKPGEEDIHMDEEEEKCEQPEEDKKMMNDRQNSDETVSWDEIFDKCALTKFEQMPRNIQMVQKTFRRKNEQGERF